jgi:sterol 3beta-glucosyltransferase
MRIALATVGTTGDIRPFAILARRLVERGHGVTAISWPAHRTALAQPGVRVEVAGPHADPARIAAVAAEAARHRPMEQVAILRDFHLADGEAHYRALRQLLPGHDLVVLHGIHALAHAAALDAGLPWASAVFDPVLLPTASAPPPGMPSLGPVNRLAWWMLGRALRRAARPLDELLARAGSAQRAVPLFRARSPRLHLVACSPSIVTIPPDLPAATRVTGAWLDRSEPEPLPASVEAFVADGAPPIVITFGSMAGASAAEMHATITALLDAGRRVVLQGSVAVESPSLLQVGALDHRALFPRASAIIHHGGAGTTHAACAAGVPSVVVPHLGDQRFWADRLHRLGVAPPPVPASQLTAEALVDAALSAASDRGFRETAGHLAARMDEEDGLAESIAWLERMERHAAPTPR